MWSDVTALCVDPHTKARSLTPGTLPWSLRVIAVIEDNSVIIRHTGNTQGRVRTWAVGRWTALWRGAHGERSPMVSAGLSDSLSLSCRDQYLRVRLWMFISAPQSCMSVARQSDSCSSNLLQTGLGGTNYSVEALVETLSLVETIAFSPRLPHIS